MTNKEIGQKLRELRKKQGWTLEELTGRLPSGNSKEHLSKYELGAIAISEAKINEILKIYGFEIKTQRVIKRLKINEK